MTLLSFFVRFFAYNRVTAFLKTALGAPFSRSRLLAGACSPYISLKVRFVSIVNLFRFSSLSCSCCEMRLRFSDSMLLQLDKMSSSLFPESGKCRCSPVRYELIIWPLLASVCYTSLKETARTLAGAWKLASLPVCSWILASSWIIPLSSCSLLIYWDLI